ncbi:MAG: alanine--tRNA ligase [Puniceicoccaceae bacterium]|nr:MAG: alanine--tRNA ligase [Puniceicoccaceae bacterium]
MTSAEIRQSFLDFFAARGHSIVPSSPLLPDAPNLLFTNAGMNQFVPYFLGDREAPYPRAADTQKCIRAGGKHNDLEDVGFDTYHHTFFEMLGNWSFGDYFKQESLEWGWELLTKVWGMPPKRLFATVYQPAEGDPAEFDHEAAAIWARLFKDAGLDPEVHLVMGNRKDNFWMMGDTGPCGPCSEIHFNLLPDDDETAGRALVNAGSPRCIEIWNHVFIQFNANADGSFSPLAAKHVDTGMGFERVAGIAAGTKGFTDFTAEPSNYDADAFAPLFARVAELSGKTYAGTVPTGREDLAEQERVDVAFRVLADHARCISCAVADGILPGSDGRNYVIRRILRRCILYGKKLGLETGFFEQLIAPVVDALGAVFPELVQQQEVIRRVIRSEEESFGRTLERGLQVFEKATGGLGAGASVPGAVAFELYDTYGFPLDMTQLLAAERGMAVDTGEFDRQMEAQRTRARAAQKKEVIVAATEGSTRTAATPFIGYNIGRSESFEVEVTDLVETADAVYLVFDRSPFYAEMGGQVGDRGVLLADGVAVQIGNTLRDKAGRHLHQVSNLAGRMLPEAPEGSVPVEPPFLKQLVGRRHEAGVNMNYRRAVQRHHTATHLLHFALRKVLGPHVRQAGSLNAPDRLRFDFSHFEAVAPEQLAEIEAIVNARVLDNAEVQAYELPYAEVMGRKDILQFFGEKYGETVRVVDIGGYSKELCGGTHVATTGEIGSVRIVTESAIAAGTRRIEAVAGEAALAAADADRALLRETAGRLGVTPAELATKLDQVVQKLEALEKQARAQAQRSAASQAEELAAAASDCGGLKVVAAAVEAADPNALRTLGAQVLARLGEGVVVLGSADGEKVSVAALASPAAIKKGHHAGTIMKSLMERLGGRGGGKPDFAMGGGKNPADLEAALAEWKASLTATG